MLRKSKYVNRFGIVALDKMFTIDDEGKTP